MNCRRVLGDLVCQMNVYFAQVLAKREGDTRPFPRVDVNEMWAFLGSVVCDPSFKYSYHPHEFCYSMAQVRNTMSAHQCSHIHAWFGARLAQGMSAYAQTA